MTDRKPVLRGGRLVSEYADLIGYLRVLDGVTLLGRLECRYMATHKGCTNVRPGHREQGM